MSGTSLDGVDVVSARLHWQRGGEGEDPHLQVANVEHWSHPLPPDLKTRLLALQAPEAPCSLPQLAHLQQQLSRLYADACLAAFEAWGSLNKDVVAIACHGQTIYHAPSPNSSEGYSWQLGDGSLLAAYLNTPTLSNFRPADMAFGGQGAPLVPFFDALFWANRQEGLALQNLGGIGNVTVLPQPSTASSSSLPIQAFDTGPANMLLDAATQWLFQRPYDADAALASQGKVDAALLATLQQHPFYQQAPPKSTGRETFGLAYLQEQLAQHPRPIQGEDLLATLTELTAWSIADAYHRFIPPEARLQRVICSGGGAFNPLLMRRLQAWCDRLFPQGLRCESSSTTGITPQSKEALAFATLGWAAWNGLPNNVPSCTGASHFSSLGQITRP